MSEYSSDSDDERYSMDLSQDVQPNPLTTAFRKSLAQWKQTQLKHVLKDDQNTTALNAYLKSTTDLHAAFESYLQGNTKVASSLPDTLRSLLGDIRTLASDVRTEISFSLFRDLIAFPFTYDTKLINSFQTDEVLQTNIIPNK